MLSVLREFEGTLREVPTFGEDSEGYILHEQYSEGDQIDDHLSLFVGFVQIPKQPGETGRPHLIPLGRTYADSYDRACSVMMSYPAVQEKLAAYALSSMTVRSDLNLFLRLSVPVPEWAVKGGR